MPRQKTAFAFDEPKVIVAPKDARAAHSSNNARIVSSPGVTHGLHFDWTENATQDPATVAGEEIPRGYRRKKALQTFRLRTFVTGLE
jgi:hypothetical protein